MSDTPLPPAGPPWGFMLGGVFVHVPKLPLTMAGHERPPFDVEMPDGRVRHIIERPDPPPVSEIPL